MPLRFNFNLSTWDLCLEIKFCRNLITFTEYGNFGLSADTSRRVGWVKKLDKATIENMASVNFIDDKKEWIDNHPY